MELTIGAIISTVGIVASLLWNLYNHVRTSKAAKLARFERHVATPLTQVVLAIEDAADQAAVLADPKSFPWEDRKRQVSEDLYLRVLTVQKRLIRALPMADRSKASGYSDWTEVLDSAADNAATDEIAEAIDSDEPLAFDEHLQRASEHLRGIAQTIRTRLERES